MGDVLTAAEVSRWLRIPKSTVYKLAHEGEIPAKKIGRHWRFQKSVVENWLSDHRNRESGSAKGQQEPPQAGKEA